MSKNCEQIQAQLSGYVDDELDRDALNRVEAHLHECANCRDELESLQGLVTASAALGIADPPDEVWDDFLDNVYNRVERRAGWMVFLLGISLLVGLAVYSFVVLPWATPGIKLAAAAPIAGMGILFVSVLRERIAIAKTDRYSRDVKR